MTQFRKVMRVGQAFLSIAALSGLLMSAAAPMARADDDHSKCQHRIEKAERNLDIAVHKHGEHSAAADERRRQLNEEREHCWSAQHGYWSGADHRWHDQRDWDGAH